MHKHKILAKIINILQLGIIGSTIPMTVLSTVNIQNAYADSTQQNNSGSSSQAFNQLQDLVGKQNNVYNPKFPDSVKSAISSKNGALSYNEQAQVAITYGILTNGYPCDYSSLYKTGNNVISQLNSALPGLKVPNMGTDKFVQDLSNSAGSEGGGHMNQKNGPTKADEIATSTFPTDMSQKAIQDWSNQPQNKDLANLVHTYASNMADNALSAIGINNEGATPVAWADDTLHQNNAIGNFVNTIKNNVKAAFNGGKSSATWEVGFAGGDTKAFNPGVNGTLNSYRDQVIAAIEYDLLSDLKTQGSNINSKSDLQSYLNKQTPYEPGSTNLNSKNSWASVLPSYGQNWSVIGNSHGVDIIGMSKINSNGNAGTSSISKDQAIQKFNTENFFIAPSTANTIEKSLNEKKVDSQFNSWYSHFQNKIHQNSSGSQTVSDSAFKGFQQMCKSYSSQKSQVQKATSGDSVLSWVPVVPYNSKWSNLSSGSAFPGGYLQSNGVLMRSQDQYGTLTGSMLTDSNSKSNALYVGNPVTDKDNRAQLIAAGDKDAVLTDGDSIDCLSAISKKWTDNSIENMVSNALDGNKSVTGTLYGYDSYGDIINGKSLKVVVPYWLNTTIKSIDQLKNPIIECPISNVDVSTMNFKQCGAGQVSNGDIESIDKSDAATIEKVRDALKNSNSCQSQQKYIESVNSAVSNNQGNVSHTKLSQIGAAALSVLITAETHDQIKQYNSNFLNKTKSAQQLFIGEEINANPVASKNNQGTGLYTAADVIQRYGLETDYGLFGILRKTMVSALVSMYNTDFMQTEGQNVFATQVFNAQSELNRLGSEPYFWAMIVIDFIFAIITVFQYYRGEVKATAFITRFFKILAIIILFGLIGIGIIPNVETEILNGPFSAVMNTPIKRESVLDMWDKIREQQSVNNVFYADMMQDNFGGINRSSSYLIPFYTSTRLDGEIDPSVSDPMDPNYHKIQGATVNTVPPQDQMLNKMMYREGDGKVPPLAPYEYKKVYISLMDLTNWASHMSRQVLSAENKPGFTKGDPDYEAPAEGFKPGEEPLFTWLSENYQPIKVDNSSSSVNANANADTTNDVSSSVSSSSTSSSSSSMNSSSSSSSGNSNQSNSGDGFGDYGTTRNPADTAGKSAYNSPYSNGTIDNSEMYKNLDKYSEFTVNTKHYATKSGLQYGIDHDSQGTQITASQAFLHIWENIFYNSGDNANPGDANSLNSLMDVAQAIKGKDILGGMQMPSNQKTSPDVGTDPNNPNINENTIEQTGRNDLINELSMTKYQREQLNGGDGRFSTAAQQMIDAFHIPAGKSDYFNLDRPNSIINIMHPYYEQGSRAYDGLIFSINKKMLNDYINIYSDVRACLDPNGANSSDDSGNNQPDHQGVDPLTMAEDQVMAADMFFTINQKLHYRMFATGYDPHSITLDSYNRMLFIPISMMKQLNDTANYDLANRTGACNIALQDNVAEYIGLTSGPFTLVCFDAMNFFLIIFGAILSLFFLLVYPIMLTLTLIRYLILSKGSPKGILVGNLFAILMFSVMKLGLGILCEMSNWVLNNTTKGQESTEPPVIFTSLIIIVYLLIMFKLIFRYGKFAFRKAWTLGATDDGHIFKDYRDSVLLGNHKSNGNSKLNRAHDNRRKYNNSNQGILTKLSNHATHIKRIAKLAIPEIVSRTMRKNLENAGTITRKTKNKLFLKKDNDDLDSLFDNLENAPAAGIDQSSNMGLDIDKIKSTGTDNGQHLKSSNAVDGYSFDISGLRNTHPELFKAETPGNIYDILDKANENPDGYQYRLNDKDQLMVTNPYMNDTMTTSPERRKELLQPVVESIYHSVADNTILDPTNYQVKNTKKPLVLPGFTRSIDKPNELSIDVNEHSGIDPKRLKMFLRSFELNKYFDILDTPVKNHSGYTNGKLTLRLKDQYNNQRETILGNILERSSRYINPSKFKANNRNQLSHYIRIDSDPDKFLTTVKDQLGKSKDKKINRRVLNNGILIGNRYYSNNGSDLNQFIDQVKNSYKKPSNGLTDLNNAMSAYIMKGNSHGLNQKVINDNHKEIVSQFKVNRNMNGIAHGITTLRNISTIPGIVMKGNDIQTDINKSLVNANEGPVGLARQYLRAAKEMNMKLPDKVNQIYDKMNEIESISGTQNPDLYSDDTRSKLDTQLKKMNNTLKDSGQLNSLQTRIISSSDNINVKKALNAKQQFLNNLIKEYHIPSNEIANLTKNMTIDQITEASSTLSNIKNMELNKEDGILNTKIPKNGDQDKVTERLQSTIKALSN